MTTSTSLPSLTVEDVAIDLLRPDPANPRRIGDEELDALERSVALCPLAFDAGAG